MLRFPHAKPWLERSQRINRNRLAFSPIGQAHSTVTAVILTEDPLGSLQRELGEELGIHVEVGAELGTFDTVVGTDIIGLQCFWCTVMHEHDEVRWCHPTELSSLNWAAPDLTW